MNLPTPESETQPPITVLKGNIVEVPYLERELRVSADNVGAKKWQEMREATQNDGQERGLMVFRNFITGRFTESDIIKGTSEHVFSSPDMHGSKSKFSSAAVTVHTHFADAPEAAHLTTTPPVDGDLQVLFNTNFGSGTMIVLDKSGAHLLVRTEKLRGDPPAADLIDRLIGEVHANGGTSLDVQRKLNERLFSFGVSYYFTDSLTPDEDGTVTFRKP